MPSRNRHGIGSRAWRNLRDRVVNEEPTCWLRLPGCTTISTTADHVIPRSVRPDLAMVRSNLHGACFHCNSKRGNRSITAGQARKPTALGWFDPPDVPLTPSDQGKCKPAGQGGFFEEAEDTPG